MLDAEGEGTMIVHNVDNYLTVDIQCTIQQDLNLQGDIHLTVHLKN